MITTRRGFTLAELTIAMIISSFLLAGIWSLLVGVAENQQATFHEADRRESAVAVERALGLAVRRAGFGMASSANFAGLHVQVGSNTDTLYVIEAGGARMRIASRSCRPATTPGCIVLVGDHRARVPAGTMIVVGSETTGLLLRVVTGDPVAFSDVCGPDCLERILCAFAAGPSMTSPAVAGSMRFPPGGGPGTPSPEPCPQPHLADGTRCDENHTALGVTPVWPDRCVTAGPASTFTELRTASAGAEWGYPASGAPVALRAGAATTPAPMAQAVRITRYWVRAEDSTLVREGRPAITGGWLAIERVAGPIQALRIETLHHGETGWRRGIGIAAADLARSDGNPNFRRAPAGNDAPRSWTYLRGYNTVAVARLTYEELRPVGADSVAPVTTAFVVPTPSLRTGSRPEDSQ